MPVCGSGGIPLQCALKLHADPLFVVVVGLAVWLEIVDIV